MAGALQRRLGLGATAWRGLTPCRKPSKMGLPGHFLQAKPTPHSKKAHGHPAILPPTYRESKGRLQMRTIEVNVTVEQGRLFIAAPIDIPADIPDGQHQAVIVIDESVDQPQVLQLAPPREWMNGPAEIIFSH